MVQHDFGTLDTPRTLAGDATYLDQQPDFDMTQEPSFQSPSKDKSLLQQLRHGRPGGVNLRTPRGSRAILGDRRNQLPQGIAGAEFTPMLKSATRNSARRFGKENTNGLTTPAALGKIDEDMDMTNIPVESSLYGPSRGSMSYIDATPMPETHDTSDASTPIVLPPRRGGDKGPLNDGNQLSLREQENVIDRIEKENFGLKLKIHFLEEALRKAGPGFSEAALKENTELKVDKVTLQRDLQKYKKQLTNAEKDLETYSQQILDMREKAKKKYADESQKIEIDRLRQDLEDKEADIEDLQRQLDQGDKDSGKLEQLQDEIGDLEADLREKDRELSERDDEVDTMKDKLEEAEDRWKSAEERIAELEKNAGASDELDEAKETIEDLESSIRRLEQQVDEMKEDLQQAVVDRDRAQGDLEELQDEMSNKSVVTKGLSRQLEEKVARLQMDLEKSQEQYASLEQQTTDKDSYTNELKTKAKQLLQQRDSWEEERQSLITKLKQAEGELSTRTDEKNLLQLRHDALGDESTSLQQDLSRLQKQIDELEGALDQEKAHALQIEQDVRNKFKLDIEQLNDEISDLQAEVREKDNLYDNDSEKWEDKKRNLESERDRAEERATGLQRTIDKLREAEGSLSNKETKLQEALNSETERHRSEEAVLSRQIDDLRQDLETRQTVLKDLRAEISAVRDELRQSQLDHQSSVEKVEALEDEVEVLQATLDEESEQASQDLAKARQERDELRYQLQASGSNSQQASHQSSESLKQLQTQLSNAAAQLNRADQDKHSLQSNLADLNRELQLLRSSHAEAKAEREEVNEELRRLRGNDNDTFKFDQERVDLRTSKVRLEGEVRRLRDENRSLVSQYEIIEKNLGAEVDKAAAEEERLNREILSLQAMMRQSSGHESQGLAAARRTIRDLERKVQEYETQIAAQSLHPTTLGGISAEGNSELSLMRRDLSSARQKELDLLQREASHKDDVRGLKRQITDLERKLHEAEMAGLARSPNASSSTNSGSARKREVTELRHQLSLATKSLQDLRQKMREAERVASKSTAEQETLIQDLQTQLEELEDQKLSLEYDSADLQNAIAEAKSQHERAVRKLEHQVLKLQSSTTPRQGKLDGDDVLDLNERKELRAMLRESQGEVQALEHDIRAQAKTLKAYEAAQKSLGLKLDRVRNERTAYQVRARKLQDDCARLKEGAQEAIAWIESHKASHSTSHANAAPTSAAYEAAKQLAAQGRTSIRSANVVLDVVDQRDHEAVIRAADEAARRHDKELRGLALQMRWMQARWERETKLRSDAAFAKKFLELRLSVAEACNKADLRILAQIHKQLGIQSPEALLQQAQHRHGLASSSSSSSAKAGPSSRARRNLRVFATALRAVARMQISARAWSKHEKTRRRLAEAWEETKKTEPVRRWDGDDTSGSPGHDDGEAQGRHRTERGENGGGGGDDNGRGRGGAVAGRKRKTVRDDDACVEFRF